MQDLETPQSRSSVSPLFVEPEPPIIGDAGGAATAVLRLTVKGTMNAQACYWYWDFLQSVAGQAPADPAVPLGAIQNLVAAYTQNVVNPLMAQLTSAYTVNVVGVSQISSRTAQNQDITPSGWPKAGSVSGGNLPQNVAMCVTKYTQFRGRRGRGRCYIPGMPATAVQNGVLLPAFLNTIGPIIQLIMGGFVVSPLAWFPAVTSGHTKRVAPGPPPVYEVGVRGNQVVRFAVHTDTRTARRRNIGRGI